MILSIIKPASRPFFVLVLIALGLMLCCFKSSQRMNIAEAVRYSNTCLNQCYDPSADTLLKKWELGVTVDLVVRLRRTYPDGKQISNSFRIRRFNDLTYMGTADAGTLTFKTDADNVINQTFNDPKGDQDNMVRSMSIPVKNMEPERVDSLRSALLFLKNGK